VRSGAADGVRWLAAAFALGLAAGALVAEPARATDVVGRDAAELEWAPARGEVAAYVVFVSRNGGAYRSEQYTREPRARVPGSPGETVQVRVRAYGLSGDTTLTSAASEPSEPIRFLAAEPPLAAAPAGSSVAPAAPPPAKLAPARDARRIPGVLLAPQIRVETHGDFDGDGDLDLLATLGSWRHPIALFLEDGSLQHAAVLAPLGETTSALAADFDGDGRDEIALRSAGVLSVMRLDRSGKLAAVRREAIPTAARLVTADLDGDGARSLVVYDAATGRLTERLAERNADFGVIRPLHALYAGDFDGDGRDDLWIQTSPGPNAELWLMDGTGSFAVAPVSLGRSVGAAAVADVNGDGRADLAGYDAARDELRAWLLDGGRVVGERVLASGPVDRVTSGDVDGDGLDDLVLAGPDGETSALVLSR
jgi:hypothetical protein